MESSNTIDYDVHWTQSLDTYRNHPTSRHRRRYVLEALKREGVARDTSVFDYGCGAGILLEEIQENFGLPSSQLGGCDISEEAIGAARRRIQSPYFYHGEFPKIDLPMDIGICTEVIEHTDQYVKILEWFADNLKSNGIMIVTTQGGSLDPPDAYYGHVQHFRLHDLITLLRTMGFSRQRARYWGFPLFTLQKWITKQIFARIRDGYMIGQMSSKKRLAFSLAYFLYFIHDAIPFGPQIFITAKKGPTQRAAATVERA